MTSKPEYTRFLPHFHHPGAIFFVTFRLHGSLPREYLQQITEQYQKEIGLISERDAPEVVAKATYVAQRTYFQRMEDALDQARYGPTYLSDPAIAQFVVAELNKFDGELYHLYGFSIMPNHVHLLLDFSAQFDEHGELLTAPFRNLDFVMFRIKGASAYKANQLLNRRGVHFWQREYHDRYIRNQRHLFAAVDYIKQNPVRAGLCKHWHEHPFTWVHDLF